VDGYRHLHGARSWLDSGPTSGTHARGSCPAPCAHDGSPRLNQSSAVHRRESASRPQERSNRSAFFASSEYLRSVPSRQPRFLLPRSHASSGVTRDRGIGDWTPGGFPILSSQANSETCPARVVPQVRIWYDGLGIAGLPARSTVAVGPLGRCSGQLKMPGLGARRVEPSPPPSWVREAG
jgi:hypothetical protein